MVGQIPKAHGLGRRENIDETLTFYRLPRQHHKHLKSTNMLERLNEEIRRRTHARATNKLLHAHGYLAGARSKERAFDADDVSEVEMLRHPEDVIAQDVATEVKLDLA